MFAGIDAGTGGKSETQTGIFPATSSFLALKTSCIMSYRYVVVFFSYIFVPTHCFFAFEKTSFQRSAPPAVPACSRPTLWLWFRAASCCLALMPMNEKWIRFGVQTSWLEWNTSMAPGIQIAEQDNAHTRHINISTTGCTLRYAL